MLDDLTILIDDLVPGVNYGVVRDVAQRETIVVRGDEIKRTARFSRDFQHFNATERLWERGNNHVRVKCGDFFIGVWRDPTRPELNQWETPEQPADFEVIPEPALAAGSAVDPDCASLIAAAAVAISQALAA